MTCPVCHKKSLQDSSSLQDESAAELKECDYCGALWTYSYKNHKPVLVNLGTNLQAACF